MVKSVNSFLKESSRIFISKDGGLYFAYLLREDEASIACSIVNTELQNGFYGPFFKLIVTPHNSELVNEIVIIL